MYVVVDDDDDELLNMHQSPADW